MRLRGFTLIELLVVITIIVFLAGILLAVSGPVRQAMRASKTRSILAVVQQGLDVSASDRGAWPTPTEHPFAGSKATRLRFRGLREGVWRDLRTAGEALCGVSATRIEPASHDLLLQDDDVCNEPDLPAFFGLRRGDMGVLGAVQAAVTRKLDLGRYPGTGVIPSGTAGYRPWDGWVNETTQNPVSRVATYTTDDLPQYPSMSSGNRAFPREEYLLEGVVRIDEPIPRSNGYLRTTFDYVARSSSPQGPAANRTALEQAIPGALLDDLRSLGALQAPADDLAANRIVIGPTVPKCQQWVPALRTAWLESKTTSAAAQVVDLPAEAEAGRVWSNDAGQSAYEPGRIRPALDGSGTWRTYRLRGAALYDAWGSELLYVRTAAGRLALVSAGRDRCFALVPGLPDATGAPVFATVLTSGNQGPTAPDRDGSLDNISLEARP